MTKQKWERLEAKRRFRFRCAAMRWRRVKRAWRDCAAADGAISIRYHSFSYNAEGWSPSRIVQKRTAGGMPRLCDFDVLDGLEEFLDAARVVGLRAAVHRDTRLRQRMERSRDQLPTNERWPIMGGGFPARPKPGTAAAAARGLRGGCPDAQRGAIGRINERLPEIAVNFSRE